MKKIISILVIIILFFSTSFFVYSAITDTLDNQKTVKISDMQQEAGENICNFNCNNYIEKMTLLITISFAIFGIFIAFNIIDSNQNRKEAKWELSKLKSECEKLKQEKNSIIESIKDEGVKLFDLYFDEFRTRYIIKEIETLLLKSPPNKETVFIKLSEIIEYTFLLIISFPMTPTFLGRFSAQYSLSLVSNS